MPLHFGRKSKSPVETSRDSGSQSRPLVYAQSSYTPSSTEPTAPTMNHAGVAGQHDYSGPPAPRYGQQDHSTPLVPQYGQQDYSAPSAPQYGHNDYSAPPPPRYGQQDNNALPPPQYGQQDNSAVPPPQYGKAAKIPYKFQESSSIVTRTAIDYAPRKEKESEKKTNETEDEEAAKDRELGFVRPRAPPKGSRHNEWETYHQLPRDHPTFLYPDDVRAKMYAKGTDPVVMAEMDKHLRGKVYGGHMEPGFKGHAKGTMRKFGALMDSPSVSFAAM